MKPIVEAPHGEAWHVAATHQPPVVSIDHVAAACLLRTGTFQAPTDIALHVSRGEFISLIGPSDCGKSTLLRLIADPAQPTSGHLRAGGGVDWLPSMPDAREKGAPMTNIARFFTAVAA